jgi:hypothetical protein
MDLRSPKKSHLAKKEMELSTRERIKGIMRAFKIRADMPPKPSSIAVD